MRQSLRFALGLAMLLGGCGEPVAQSTPAAPTTAPTIAPAATATTAPTIAPAATATTAPAATATIAPAGGAAGDAPPAADTLPGDAELPAPPNSEPYAPGADAASDAAIAEHGALPATLLGSQTTQSAIAVYRSTDSLADLRTFYGEAIKGANWLGYRTETSNDKLLLGYQYGGRGPYDIAQVVALPDPATQGATSLVIITIGTAE